MLDIRAKYILLMLWLFVTIIVGGFAFGASWGIIFKLVAVFFLPAFIATLVIIVLEPKEVVREEQNLSEKLARAMPIRERLFYVLPGVAIISLAVYLVRTDAPEYIAGLVEILGTVYWALSLAAMYKKTKRLQDKPHTLTSDRRFNIIVIVTSFITLAVIILLIPWLFSN